MSKIGLNVHAVCEYLGDGMWADDGNAKVRIEKFNLLPALSEGAYFTVDFNTDDWNVDERGLLYTSASFLNGIRGILAEFMDPELCSKIEWTEQGMQGDNYASLCVECNDAARFREEFTRLSERYEGEMLDLVNRRIKVLGRVDEE